MKKKNKKTTNFLWEILKIRNFWKMCDKELIYVEFFKLF